MGNVVSTKTEETITKALLSKDGPQALALRLHNCGVARDEAEHAATLYAERSGTDTAKVLSAFAKVYRKPLPKPQAVRNLVLINAQTIQHTEYTEPIFVIEKI